MERSKIESYHSDDHEHGKVPAVILSTEEAFGGGSDTSAYPVDSRGTDRRAPASNGK